MKPPLPVPEARPRALPRSCAVGVSRRSREQRRARRQNRVSFDLDLAGPFGFLAPRSLAPPPKLSRWQSRPCTGNRVVSFGRLISSACRASNFAAAEGDKWEGRVSRRSRFACTRKGDSPGESCLTPFALGKGKRRTPLELRIRGREMRAEGCSQSPRRAFVSVRKTSG